MPQLNLIIEAVEALPPQFQEAAKVPDTDVEGLKDVWVPTWEVSKKKKDKQIGFNFFSFLRINPGTTKFSYQKMVLNEYFNQHFWI